LIVHEREFLIDRIGIIIIIIATTARFFQRVETLLHPLEAHAQTEQRFERCVKPFDEEHLLVFSSFFSFAHGVKINTPPPASVCDSAALFFSMDKGSRAAWKRGCCYDA
jgi:hypothetical protein